MNNKQPKKTTCANTENQNQNQHQHQVLRSKGRTH